MDLWAAVVELVTVVVGILIALWVNDWNQRRLNRRQENAYIRSLRDDISADVEALDQQIAFANGTAEAARSLIGLIRGEQLLPDRTVTLRTLKRAGMMYPFLPTKTTFQELSGGGNLSIVTDREVLRAVIAYYSAAEMPREASSLAIRRIWVEYYDALSRTIDPVLIPGMTVDVFGLLREGIHSPDDVPDNRVLPGTGLGATSFEPTCLVGAEDLDRALAMVLDSSVLVRESLTDLRDHASGLLRRLEHARS